MNTLTLRHRFLTFVSAGVLAFSAQAQESSALEQAKQKIEAQVFERSQALLNDKWPFLSLRRIDNEGSAL